MLKHLKGFIKNKMATCNCNGQCRITGKCGGNMSLSCEKVRTSDRTAQEEAFLENRNRYAKSEIGLAEKVDREYRGLGYGEQAQTSIYDPVNHPAHYNSLGASCSCGRPIECIDVTRNLNFNIGNAVKYLWRCELKGNSLEDLKKAAWYIQDEINRREKSV